MSSYYRQQLEEWLKEIDIKSEFVLDVGGLQNPIKGRTKTWNVDRYIILDLPDPNFHNAKEEWEKLKRQTDYRYLRYDINDDIRNEINVSPEASQALKNSTDIIFCLEVMEYVWNPVQVIHNLRYILKDNGVLYISFPFLYPLHPPTGDDLMRYTKYGAKKLLEKFGFEIETITAREAENPELLLNFYNAERYRYDKTEDLSSLTETGYLIKAIKRPVIEGARFEDALKFTTPQLQEKGKSFQEEILKYQEKMGIKSELVNGTTPTGIYFDEYQTMREQFFVEHLGLPPLILGKDAAA